MLYTKLMQHQVEIVDFGEERDYAGIFSDYGTGKSYAALVLAHIKHWRKVLVISTKTSIESTWPSEVETHTNFRYVTLLGTRREKLKSLVFGLRKTGVMGTWREGTTVIFLVNYEGIKNIFHELCQTRFDVIIADESTKIKNVFSNRGRLACTLAKTVPKRYIMTGFPVTENLVELYGQVKFLDDGQSLGGNYYKFINTYFVKIGPKLVLKKGSLQRILECIKPFCIRITNERLKLPPAVFKLVTVGQTEQQQQMLLDLKQTFMVELGKVKIDTQSIFTLIAKSFQICDGFIQDQQGNIETVKTNKDIALEDILEEIDPFKNKVVIWAAFRFSVKKILYQLKKWGIPAFSVTGEDKNIGEIVKMFQTGDRYRVLVATQKKAAESITLTEARYAIYYSNTWSADNRGNSEARIRRKGSEKHESIIYTDIMVKGSIEKRVYDCLREKKNLIVELKKEFLRMREELK